MVPERELKLRSRVWRSFSTTPFRSWPRWLWVEFEQNELYGQLLFNCFITAFYINLATCNTNLKHRFKPLLLKFFID